MKYVWIVMLALIEITWILLSVIDIYVTINLFGKNTDWDNFAETTWDNFAETTKMFIKTHLIGLFAFSLLTWLGA